ncbi:hypothetical protein [Kordiimonas sp. SCSIO 12610]|uniref:hypothetical protein n=1 Tax=Kordiimonas sp. SCSIO 12610 TaxID=2829597 RepID=UPI00210C19EC|nr:hypothetical protein [Kordiimonas sp. SCSIO 12610]UTW55836.1 hypothetical protein KFF44_02800 [Kordiimonas sp. SCSIO 12610]
MNRKIDDDLLDSILAVPLGTVEDNGFTSGVMREIVKQKLRERTILAGMLALAFACLMIFFPVQLLTPDIKSMSYNALLIILVAVMVPFISLFMIADN